MYVPIEKLGQEGWIMQDTNIVVCPPPSFSNAVKYGIGFAIGSALILGTVAGISKLIKSNKEVIK